MLLTASESGQLQKQVYDAQGKAMSHTPFQVKLPKNGEARWVAPTLKASERVMIQSDNQFTLYDAKGHSILRYDAAARSDGNYEHIRVDDWDFSAYPYLAIEYEGQRTMASDFFIQLVNLYDKSVKPLPGLAIDKQVKIDAQNRLQAWSSFLYEGIGPANAISPDLAEKQSFHAAYSLSSGKPLVDHKQLFEQPKGMEPSGWETQIAGSYVFVRDLKAGSWSLYPATASAPITSAHTGLEADAKFIGYHPASKIAYFLVKTSSGTQTTEVRKIQL
ncbi:hypothetical protein B9G55_16610 [Saccharibacillus sp. O16]|nr:hypothetical protein B9G55_16610 [Saccharibacillus sp. O16]